MLVPIQKHVSKELESVSIFRAAEQAMCLETALARLFTTCCSRASVFLSSVGDAVLVDREETPHSAARYGAPLVRVQPYTIPAPGVLGRSCFRILTNEEGDHIISNGAHHFDIKPYAIGEHWPPDAMPSFHQPVPCP